MEQLFAVRVLVHYHDKSNVDHAAVRRLLSAAAVDSLDLLLTDGTSASLLSYIQTPPNERKSIAEVSGSGGSSLTQVASVFMLAEARAAADALPSSPHELETACSALERLLGCLATQRPLLPVRDIKQSARVKFGTAARRRAVHRMSRSGSDPNDQPVSILKAVNAILRLCDVATHCLAVVSRQSVSSRSSCETAVALSTRLLTLAASLYEVQKVEPSPALSFFSSNSLRTALVAGAMHLGAIAIEHLEIEPMAWIHVANRIVMSSSTLAPPRTSVLSALFGGMIKAGKRYECSERDSKAAEGAVCLLSTLHVVLETDIVRDSQGDESKNMPSRSQSKTQREPTDAQSGISMGTGAISQAARSFLGERVVAAEEDGDEGRIAARTVYQACEEYAERAGESDGMMGLLSRLFSSAGRQCRFECADEPVVSISEGTLTCHPDESDASSDGPHVRSESPPFAVDVFDQRSKDGFGASATVGSTSETGAENMDRIELHREVGALALDTLAHWVSRAQALRRYVELDMTAFTVNICRSASFLSLGNSPASYDLRAAMVDFGSLIGPILLREIREFPMADQQRKWASLVATLAGSCHRMNPILKSVLSCNKDVIVMKSLLQAFLERNEGDEQFPEQNAEVVRGLPVASLLHLLTSLLAEENALEVVEGLSNFVKVPRKVETTDAALAHRASCLILLSRAIIVSFGIRDGSDTTRVALAALYNRDVDNVLDPVFPHYVAELGSGDIADLSGRCLQGTVDLLLASVQGIAESIDRMCFHPSFGSWETLSELAAKPRESVGLGRDVGAQSTKSAKLCFHMFWSCVMLHKALEIVAKATRFNFVGLSPSSQNAREFPLSSPFVCMKAIQSKIFNDRVKERLSRRQKPSIPLLYTAECLALLHPQSGMRSDDLQAFSGQDLPPLFASLVTNVVDIASDYVCGDVASNFKALQRAFRKDSTLDIGDLGGEEVDLRPQFCSDMTRQQASFACLQLAMAYMRDVGSNQIAQLLGTVMVSATYLLERFTSQQLFEARDLMFDVAQFLLFLPDSFGKLGKSIFRFLKLYVSLSFTHSATEDAKVEEMVVFLARVSGFSKIVELGSSSGTGIHHLCKFARDSEIDASFDSGALQISLMPANVSDKFGKEFSAWLKGTVPRVTLSGMLSKLLVPPGDSAVAVSAHSLSLSLLTEACEASKCWQQAVLSGMNELVLDNESFSTRLVRRSVMESVIMNESVLMIFERVVGTGDNSLSARVLVEAFTAACQLFEEDCNSSLESRIRLLTFAVRLSISYGRSSRRSSMVLSPSLLEPALFELTINSLQKMTETLNSGTVDPSAKQIVLFLCGLIDCFLHGIYGSTHSYFSENAEEQRPTAQTLKSAATEGEEVVVGAGSDKDQGSSTGSIAIELETSQEDSLRSSLCTYTTTGNQFIEQHWYFCYSCELVGSEGVCSVCARNCHKGCELAYSKFSRFFCDCGARSDPQPENASNAMSASEDGDGGNCTTQDGQSQSLPAVQPKRRKPCKCLKSPGRGDRSPSTTHESQDRKSDAVSDCDQDVRSGTRLRELLVSEIKAAKEEGVRSGLGEASSIQESFENVMKSTRTARCLIRTGLLLVKELDASHVIDEPPQVLSDVTGIADLAEERMKNSDYIRLPKTTKIARSTRVFKTGSLDMTGVVVSPERPDSLKGSLISYCPVKSVLAVGHKAGLVEFVDASDALVHTGNPLEKVVTPDYSQTSVPFEISHLSFHPENANLLLVVGSERVSILVRLPQNGSCRWSHLEIELGLTEYDGYDGSNALLDASWIGGGAALVLVTTANFVKIFDAASDTFCPCFFAKTPETEDDVEKSTTPVVADVSAAVGDSKTSDTEQTKCDEPTNVPKRTLRSAVSISRVPQLDTQSMLFVLVVTSDHMLYISRSGWNETTEPRFSFLCNVRGAVPEEDKASIINGVFYHPTESLILVSFQNGSLLCMSLALKSHESNFQASIRWVHMYRDAVPVGDNIQLIPVPGIETCCMFCRRGQTLKAGGVLSISGDRSMKVQCFSGSPSASVMGLATYAPSPVLGRSAFAGGFLVLDDGSLHRVDISSGPPRPQTSDQSILSAVIERQRLRAIKASNANSDAPHGYCAIPDVVGFFEKCRLVSDQVLVEASVEGTESDSTYERMGVILAGESGDSVVSPKENEPFKFTANLDNQSVVLVGARLRFGGTDRSRNRVPAEVKVFGRTVKWQSRNGVNRWLDIPFSVPESTDFPQQVSFELFPRRSLGESSVTGDGFVAIDALQLFAVSSIEFTERKLLYENEKSKHYESLKKRRESSEGSKCKTYSNLLCMSSRSAVANQGDFQFSQDQAALLTILNSIDSRKFADKAGEEAGSGALLLDINNLWSGVFEGSQSRDPLFLEHMLKPILGLCTEIADSDSSGDFCSTARNLLSQAIKASTEGKIDAVTSDGVLLHVNNIERSLFAVAGLARSLLISGSSVGNLKSKVWMQRYDESMPTSSTISLLLGAHFELGLSGRSLYKSSYGASGNAVDIFVVQSVRRLLESEKDTSVEDSYCVRVLVQMLCSLDQRLRLFTSQRLLELFDSLETASEIAGSPLESLVASSIAQNLKAEDVPDGHVVAPASDVGQAKDDSESAQRWAYRCDNCGEVCDQQWWHCNECEDFDLCTGCLRKPDVSFDGSHNEQHILLRGTASDDTSEQEDMDGQEEISEISLCVQQILGPLLDELVLIAGAEKDSSRIWRYLDAAETIAQLVGKRSPPALRNARLKALFDSSFASVLCETGKSVGSEIEASAVDQCVSMTVPQNAEILFLVLRIVLCAQGGLTPAYLHERRIPETLVVLLQKMHIRLQTLVRSLNSGRSKHRTASAESCSLVSWRTWNNPIQGLVYDILPQKRGLKHAGMSGGLFHVNEELGHADSVFLNLLIAVLEVLEYSFKSASSASISEQMQQMPRNVLCDIINFCESAYPYIQDATLFKESVHAATRVLSALSYDDVNALNDTLDKYLYEEQSTRLKNAVEAQGGTTDQSIGYNTEVEVATILETLHKAAVRHPATWRSYVVDHELVLRHVYDAARLLEGQIRVNALQLLAAGVAVSSGVASRVIRGLSIVDLDQQNHPGREEHPESRDAADVEPSAERSNECLSPVELSRASKNGDQVAVSIFQEQNFQMFEFLIHNVMLRCQDEPARTAASHLLILGIARAAAEAEEETFVTAIHSTLMKGIELMPYAGELADGLMECLRFFIACCQSDLFGMQSEPLLTSMSFAVTSLLKLRCNRLVSHPNARLYGRLSGMLDIHGYYLESDPCMSCSASMCESAERKECRLDTIRAETKYTDSSIMHRLLSIHEVSAISVKVIDPRRSRRVKTVDVLFSSRTVSDAAELKSTDHPWRKLRSLELGPNATDACVDLVVPIAAANIKLEFIEFHSVAELPLEPTKDGQDADGPTLSEATAARRSNSSNGANENLQCPRCSRSVTDRHGICRNCHENAYQCRQCRNINYENLDGFLCNECGYCKHGRFEFSVTGRPTFVAERVLNEEDRKRASKIIEKETGNVHRCMDQLTRMRSSIIRSLNSGIPTEEARERSRLIGNARVGLADLLDSVAPRSDIAVLEALLEQGHAPQEIEEAANSTQGGISITEEVIAESSGSADQSDRDQNNATGSGLASPVNRNGQSRTSHGDGSIISKSTTALAATYAKECRTIYTTMSRGIHVLTLTRAELVRYANTVGGSRLQYANDIVGEEGDGSANVDGSSPEVSEFTKPVPSHRRVACYGCTQSFVSKCVRLVQTIMKREGPATSAIQSSDLAQYMLLVCSLCEKSEVRGNIRDLITYLVNDNLHATQLVCNELARKIEFCIDSFETVDAHSVARFEMAILEATATLDDSCWEERLKLVIRILFKSSTHALTCSSVSESIILPCLRVALRLMRADSELTVIESTSAVDGFGSATDGASNEGLHLQASENSETENEDFTKPVPVPIARTIRENDGLQIESSSDQPRRSELLDDSRSIPGASNVAMQMSNIVGVADSPAAMGLRDQLRTDDRRQSARAGSDLMSGSGAPSSIGTAFEGHLSDDEVNGSTQRQDIEIDVRTINILLENDHDSKLLSADVGQWLEGKLDQSSWIAEMKERSTEREERSGAQGEIVPAPLYLKSVFSKWKRLGQENHTASHREPLVREDAQNHKRLSIEKDNWIVRLMLFTPCTAVRKEACALLKLICGQEETLQLQLLDVLTGPALSLGGDAGENSKEFFDLLESTLSSRSHRLYLIAKGFLPSLAGLIRTRAERLILCEANSESSLRLVNFLEGYSVKRLLSLLRQTLEAIPSQRLSLREKLFEVDNYKLVRFLERAYICMRKLISLRTRLTDDCGAQLCEVLLSRDFLFAGPTVSAVVSACVTELRSAKERDDAQTIAILLEQLCLMLCPERKEPICYLSLNKAPTQEEFIRGSMSRNPYPSSAFDGPLMRDVKNKICKDLDLPGLLEDDFAMELLVAGNLVKLDLPIMAVFDHVWRGSAAASMTSSMQPTQITRSFGLRRASHAQASRGSGNVTRPGGIRSTILTFRRINSERDGSEDENRLDSRTDPPMVVVYRLSGLDGEATEPIVDSVPAETTDEQDAEELYGDTIVFGEVGGLDVLFELLAIVGSWGDDAETAVRAPALRLLRASCEVAKNRALLAKSADAVRTLLDCAASAFEHAQGSPTAVISAESLLIAAEQILAQQRKELETHTTAMSDTVSVSSHDPEEVMSRVQVFLGRLSVATSPKAENSILHLLPFLVQGVPGAIDVVLKYFNFSWDTIDVDDEGQRKARQLGTVLLATPNDQRGDKFAEQTIRTDVGVKAVEYVIQMFPIPRSTHKEDWMAALDCQGPPLILRLLTGLGLFLGSRQEQQRAGALLRDILQQQKKIIPVLCQLEMAVSGNAIGTTAEELLDALGKDLDIRNEIEEEREGIKRARREAAKASRLAILRETGLVSEETTTDQPAPEMSNDNNGVEEESVLKLMNELPDEVGPSCVVCGDGFRCRPEEALAFYVYCRKVPLELSTGSYAAQGPKMTTDVQSNSGQGSGRVDLELWSSGRSRNHGNMSSRSGGNSCYTTVTHLNAIHLSCHKEAARADRSSRRDEWEGASLRNSQTKCNNLFPVRPPVTLKEEESGDDKAAILKSAKVSYSAAVDNYFGRLSSLGRTSLSHSKAVTYDIARSLLRFADGGTTVFSEHAKGGGPHSNACLLPHLVELAIYMVEVSPQNDPKGKRMFTESKSLQTQEAALIKFLEEDEIGDITYYLASALVLQSLEKWKCGIVSFLRRGLRDRVLKSSVLFRLIAFADLVNRALKSNLVLSDGQHWLDGLRRHIGVDEIFAQEFGDSVNEKWEEYIRSVRDGNSLLRAVARNTESWNGGGEDESDRSLLEGLRSCIEAESKG